jgi:hypothetical protein
MKLRNTILYVTLIFLLSYTVSAQLAPQIYTPVTSIICEIFKAVLNVVGALAAAVFMISGIKWVSSRDDAGARNSARTSMVHAIIGLIVVLLARIVVGGITQKIGVDATAICKGM